ncbi:hypothetical protein IJ182_06285 [bacterium]|nr:hypothetical protein [bacterium]
MGYALFAQRKVVLDAQLNSAQLEQTMASNAQYLLATKTLGLNQRLASNQASQAGQLADLYGQLSSAAGSQQRDSINADIQRVQREFDQENDSINREIYQVSVQENAIEMTVKRLDTMVTALQKQLEAVEQAEGQAIDRATPKFGGLG